MLVERYRALLEAASDGFLRYAADGRLLDCNARVCALLGRGRELLLASSLDEITCAPRPWQPTDTTGAVGFTSQLRSAGGVPIPVQVTVLADGADFCALLHVLTEPHESAARWRAALEGAGDGLFEWDMRSDTWSLSPRWRALLGDVDSTHSWRDLVHPDDLPEGERQFARYLAGELPMHATEQRIRYANGEWRWVVTRGQVERDAEGAPLRFVGTLTDVTERHELHAATQRAKDAAIASERSKMQFLASISHELRTPLNGMLGVVDLLSRTTLDAQQRELLGLAGHSGETMLTLVDDLLDSAQLEAGRMQLHNTPFSPDQALREAATVLGLQAHGKGLAFSVEARTSCWVLGDPKRFKQLVTNLLGNAIKFTSHGSVSADLRISDDADPARPWLRLEIVDTGVGIPEHARERLFGRFAQVDRGPAQTFAGSGLGLLICAQLVELMGGRIGYDSALGRGTCFWVELPFERTLEPAATAPSIAPSGYRPYEPLRVLLADDNAVNQRVVSLLLESFGHHVHAVDNGERALEALRADPSFDLVLLDCQMPVLDGYETARRIRQSPRATIPIVALTAASSADVQLHCLRAGMTAYASKPIRRSALARAFADCGLTLMSPAAWASASTRPPAFLVLDPEQVAELRSVERPGGITLFEEVAELVTRQTQRDVEQLFARCQAHDASAAKLAHKLTGTCLTVGGVQLAQLLETVEATVARGDFSRASELEPAVHRAWQTLQRELTATLNVR